MRNRIQVTKEKFFEKLKADPRDIMPCRPIGKWPNYVGEWKDKHGNLFGIDEANGDKWFLIESEFRNTQP